MVYQYLQGEHWRHIYIVGDLHGCRHLLDEQLQAHHFDGEKDLLVAVGDLIDRGPESLSCLALLQQDWFRSVRGNHEDMMLNALTRGEHDLWKLNGGEWFYRLKGAEMISAKHLLLRCREMPLIIHIALEKRIVVVAHADYPASHYAWGQVIDPQGVMWSRHRINRLQQGTGEIISGADDFYFGHTPLQQVIHAFNQYFIDTGAVFGHQLTLVQIQ